MTDAPSTATAQLVNALQQLVGERANCSARPHVSSGYEELDRLLPGQGLRRGSLTECFVDPAGSGGGVLALRMAQAVCQPGGELVVVDPTASFYPPAAAAWGIDLQRLLLVRPKQKSAALWALDQALRCPAVRAVWSYCEALDDRWFRRFQLAAELSGCLGILVRPARSIGQPSWSELQLRVTPAVPGSPPGSGSGDRDHDHDDHDDDDHQWRFRVELIRCRGQGHLGSVLVTLGQPSINRSCGLVP